MVLRGLILTYQHAAGCDTVDELQLFGRKQRRPVEMVRAMQTRETRLSLGSLGSWASIAGLVC